MAHVVGCLLIDAPASALNNGGTVEGSRTDNKVAVKHVYTRAGEYPYVSAQAFRYWWRTTLERSDLGWQAAPVWRDDKIAYTDANPIDYWDDDLFGYMRAEAKRKGERQGDRSAETPTEKTVTRVSPLRVSTLVGVAPGIADDFGVMARQQGDPVPHEHQFYRTALFGLLALDLSAAGTFLCGRRSGQQNLDAERQRRAEAKHLERVEVDGVPAYRLPQAERAHRVATLFRGLGRLTGGAKQGLHYTDVMPSFLLITVLRWANHPFKHLVRESRGLPQIHLPALEEALAVYREEMEAPIYVGWNQGYLDDQRKAFQEWLGASRERQERIVVDHPRRVLEAFARDLENPERSAWYA